jgi:hypothetical protein
MADVKGVLKQVFPFISAAAALGGPPAELAASVLGKALGTDTAPAVVAPTQAGIVGALAKASASADQLLAAQKAEIDFQIQKASLEPHHQEELERLASEDRDSARKREESVRDRVPGFLAVVVTLGFFGLLTAMLKWSPPASNKDLLNIMLGSLGTAWIAIITYYFGSSRGSDAKTAIIAAQGGK